MMDKPSPLPGTVDMGDLRRVNPISAHWGFDRGGPIDRIYIETFLESHAADIAGHVLEVGDRTYTQRFGGSRVTVSDILHVSKGTSATIVADLAQPRALPDGMFDCIIFTQTLHLIFDVHRAVENLASALRPNGTLLMTVPGITKVDHDEWGTRQCWSFTAHSLDCIVRAAGDWDDLAVTAKGNVLAATAFLHGLAVSELTESELDFQDPLYQLVVTARARKSGTAAAATS